MFNGVVTGDHFDLKRKINLEVVTFCVIGHTGWGIAGTKKPSRGGLGVIFEFCLALMAC